MTGGISILGFNNFAPYLVLIIRPELSDKIDLANNVLSIIGVLLIVLGAAIPVFIKIFNQRFLFFFRIFFRNKIN